MFASGNLDQKARGEKHPATKPRDIEVNLVNHFFELFEGFDFDGFVSWFSNGMGTLVQGWSWIHAFGVLALVYFYSHYFFASNTAQIGAMYGAFLAVAIIAGAPPIVSALLLGFFSSLFSSMTHYSTGSAPIYFGTGYVPVSDWWLYGFIISVLNISIWLGVGYLWWSFLGLM